MTRDVRGAIVGVWTAILVLLAGGAVGTVAAGAQTAAPSAPSVPATPSTQEVPSVTGAANPAEAPVVPAGSVVDTVLLTEVLWYAVDAAPGQRVGATVVVVGRPDGPTSEAAAVEVTLTDPQRQPLQSREVGFTGTADGVVEMPTAEIPAVGGERPLLSVALRSDDGEDPLAGTGYRLQLTVVVEGNPAPVEVETAAATPGGAAPPAPDVTVTAAPVPPPGDPDGVRDLAPGALVALALGGVAGVELSRRGV